MAPLLNSKLEVVARLPDGAIDVAVGALHIAADEYPQLPVGDYLARIEEWADRLRWRDLHRATAERAARTVGELLFGTEGFAGNVEHYYDPANSYLNEVINRRLGTPAALSVLFLSVARRLGVRARGVALPGHFICRVDARGKVVLVDCFNGGTLIRPRQCHELVHNGTGGAAKFNLRMLRPCRNRQVLLRLLNNLKGLYLSRGDAQRACRVIQRMTLLDPRHADHWRDLGVMLFRLGHTGPSADAFQNYLDLSPHASDHRLIRDNLQQLRRWSARQN